MIEIRFHYFLSITVMDALHVLSKLRMARFITGKALIYMYIDCAWLLITSLGQGDKGKKYIITMHGSITSQKTNNHLKTKVPCMTVERTLLGYVGQKQVDTILKTLYLVCLDAILNQFNLKTFDLPPSMASILLRALRRRRVAGNRRIVEYIEHFGRFPATFSSLASTVLTSRPATAQLISATVES